MTPEERQKRMEERMKNMTPEERAAFQARMAQRGRGGREGGSGREGGAVQNARRAAAKPGAGIIIASERRQPRRARAPARQVRSRLGADRRRAFSAARLAALLACGLFCGRREDPQLNSINVRRLLDGQYPRCEGESPRDRK